MAKRMMVIDADTATVENVIVVDDNIPFAIPGKELVEDTFGAAPGDRWDPTEHRPYRPVTTIGTSFEVLKPSELATLQAKISELEQAISSGDVDAVQFILGGLPVLLESITPKITDYTVAVNSRRIPDADG